MIEDIFKEAEKIGAVDKFSLNYYGGEYSWEIEILIKKLNPFDGDVKIEAMNFEDEKTACQFLLEELKKRNKKKGGGNDWECQINEGSVYSAVTFFGSTPELACLRGLLSILKEK